MEGFVVLFGIWILQVLLGYYFCKYFYTKIPVSNDYSMTKSVANEMFVFSSLIPVGGFILIFVMFLIFVAIKLENINLFD